VCGHDVIGLLGEHIKLRVDDVMDQLNVEQQLVVDVGVEHGSAVEVTGVGVEYQTEKSSGQFLGLIVMSH
jgi:hypothetical protein